MLFTDYVHLISSADDNGKELKDFADMCKLKYQFYFSYQLDNGNSIKYFYMTKARSRNILPYIAGNIQNKTNIRVFLVRRAFLKKYLKKGVIPRFNIVLNLSRLNGMRIYPKLFLEGFGLKVEKKKVVVKIAKGFLRYTYTYLENEYEITFTEKTYEFKKNGVVVVLEEGLVNFIGRFLYNKTCLPY